MMRSLFAGVSALRNHQVRMDVIGNNIANVNTIGFKGSTVTFQELLNQTVRDATAPQGDEGGTNPLQVGLGSELGSINVRHTQGNLQTTGVATDLAIQGDGYFVLGDGPERFFTRAGMFDVDRDGNVVSKATGLKVLGWQANNAGAIDTSASVTDLVVPLGATIDPKATTGMIYAGNLDARDNGELTYFPNPPAEITDNLGQTVQVLFNLTPTGNFNEFDWEITANNGTFTGTTSGTLRLDANGQVINQSSTADVTLNLGGGAEDITIRPPQLLQANGGTFSWDAELGDGLQDADTNNVLDDGQSTGNYTSPPTRPTSIRIFDSLGGTRDVFTHIVKTGNNSWEWTAADEEGNTLDLVDENGVDIPNDTGTLVFDTNGAILSQTGVIQIDALGGADQMTITPDFSRITQFGEEATAQATAQDGYGAGTLTSFSVDSRGVINGSFSNGLTRQLAQVATASFANPGGLIKTAGTLFQPSNNSGDALIGVADTGTRGKISSGSLEMSNIDLSQEFTDMIITQRGFQANSRIITTSDEMLQELVNLKR